MVVLYVVVVLRFVLRCVFQVVVVNLEVENQVVVLCDVFHVVVVD